MRTTLSIDDDALAFARRFAKGRRISLGQAVSDLLRRGVTHPARTKKVNGLTVFDVPLDSPKVTTEQVRRLEEDEP